MHKKGMGGMDDVGKNDLKREVVPPLGRNCKAALT